MDHTRAIIPLQAFSFALLFVLTSMVIAVRSEDTDLAWSKDIDNIDLTMVTSGRSCFTENLGQWPNDLTYMAEVGFGHIGMSGEGFVFDLTGPVAGTGNIVRYDLVGISGAEPRGVDPLPYHSNYFIGNDGTRWALGAKNFREVMYDNAWDGIDIHFSVGVEGAKYEFSLMPYADPDDIMIKVSGHSTIRSDGTDLFLTMENGPALHESGLKAFYLDGPKEPIDVSFDVKGGDLVMFKLGDYDRSRSLVIDPLLLNSTFVGSSGSDDHGEIVKDENGGIYIVGRTAAKGFPTTPGAYNVSLKGFYDLVIFKMDRYLTQLQYSTYIGGSDGEVPTDMVYAGRGEVLITGQTYSSDFPTTEVAYQRDLNTTVKRTTDLFVVHLNATGSGLLGSTYLGWGSGEGKAFIELDASGAPLILSSVRGEYVPTNSSSHDATFNGGVDMIVLRMSADLGSLTYTSYLGGYGEDLVVDIEEGYDSHIYFTGTTSSNNFPVSKDAYEKALNTTSSYVGFVGRFDPGSGDIEQCSYLNFLMPQALELDSKGNIVIGGNTNQMYFRTTNCSYQSDLGGWMDAAVVSLLPNATDVIASTYLGGCENESLFDIAVNGTDHVFITGSGRQKFPVTPGAYSRKNSGMIDCFVSVLKGDLSELVYSTLIGGSSYDYPYSILEESEEVVYISGTTMSSNYPVINGCYSGSFAGVSDLFISRMACPKIYMCPTIPLNLSGEVFDDRIVLNWSRPLWDGDAGIGGYFVSRSSGTSPPVHIATTSDLTYNDTTIDLKETYNYFITAFNRIGNSLPSNSITLWERTPPTIEEDLTPDVVKPGDDLLFKVKVTDNSLVDEVDLLYWSDVTEVVQEPMTSKGGNIYMHLTRTEDRVYWTDYIIAAIDVKGNYVSMEQKRINVSGEYLPVFEEDMTPATVESLGPLQFGVKVRDNWAQPVVHLEYWTGEGNRRNVTMGPDGKGGHYFDTKATGLPGEVITYVFRAEDVHGNWNESAQGTVMIIDGEAPTLLLDLSGTAATTGDPFVLRALVDDDVKVDWVEVHYQYDDGPDEVLPLVRSGGPLWTGAILVPHRLSSLRYMFIMTDSFENERTTEWTSIEIADNDQPSVIQDSSDELAFDGSPFTFSISVEDNIAVGKVVVVHSTNGGPGQEAFLEGEGLKEGAILIPPDAVGVFEYSVRVFDSSGNENRTETVSVRIIDNISPTIEAIDDVSTYVGLEVLVELEVSDNINISSIEWGGLPMPFSENVWIGCFGEPGTYNITVEAKDMAGNSALVWFDVHVLSRSNDIDGDGLPDLFEMDHGLDLLDPLDALDDLDGDRLTNLEEHGIGTDINRSDTDGDGMDDRWEVTNGLDPLNFSATEDPDGDGWPNIREYVEGSDPNIFDDHVVGDSKASLDFRYLIIAALVLISLVLVFFVLRVGGGRKRHSK